MADITLNQGELNTGVSFTETNGAASQTIDYSSQHDNDVVLLVRNTDAANCRIKVATNGYGGGNASALDVDVDASANAIIQLESMYYKDPDTGKVTFQVLDQDDTSFSGTVTNVKVSAIAVDRGYNT